MDNIATATPERKNFIGEVKEQSGNIERKYLYQITIKTHKEDELIYNILVSFIKKKNGEYVKRRKSYGIESIYQNKYDSLIQEEKVKLDSYIYDLCINEMPSNFEEYNAPEHGSFF